MYFMLAIRGPQTWKCLQIRLRAFTYGCLQCRNTDFSLLFVILTAAVHSWNSRCNMATATTSAKTRQRKHSFTSSLSLLNRTRSMTDQTLLGVLNILRMDEGQGHSFMVKAILPDGKPRLVRLKALYHIDLAILQKTILECCVLYLQLCHSVQLFV